MQKPIRSHGRWRGVFAVRALLTPLTRGLGYPLMLGLFVSFALNAAVCACKYRKLGERLRDFEAALARPA